MASLLPGNKTSSMLLPLTPPALQKDSSKKSNQNHSTISLGATLVKTNLFLLSGKTIPAQWIDTHLRFSLLLFLPLLI